MSADFNTSITLSGTKEEILNIFEVLKSYESGSHDAYIDSVRISHRKEKSRRLSDMSEDEIYSFLKSRKKEIYIAAEGPYGRYDGLENSGLFQDMASAAPGASFDGYMSGCQAGADYDLHTELKEGRLSLSLSYEDYGDMPESYEDYVMDKLSYDEFIELFKINSDEFDYENFISDVFTSGRFYYSPYTYEDFKEDCDCSEINEDEFKIAIEKVIELEILDEDSFRAQAYACAKSIYDPIERKYIEDGRLFR
jgi:hypothetical protein